MSSLFYRNSMRLANLGTKILSRYYGEKLGFIHIIEYPRSGGTWLGKMLSDYLSIPFPQHSIMPIGCKSVIHGHWSYQRKLKNVIYLYRDGRDVFISRYFHMKNAVNNATDPSLKKKLLRNYEYLLYDDEKESKKLYLRDWKNNPIGISRNWLEHIKEWESKNNVIYVSYESLIQNPHEALTLILKQLHTDEIDKWKLDTCIEKFSFSRMTNRKPGEEDKNSFIRKGIQGDWLNHFDRELAINFEQYFGPALKSLGYTTSNSWLDQLN